jgi:hypothetical protein
MTSETSKTLPLRPCATGVASSSVAALQVLHFAEVSVQAIHRAPSGPRAWQVSSPQTTAKVGEVPGKIGCYPLVMSK